MLLRILETSVAVKSLDCYGAFYTIAWTIQMVLFSYIARVSETMQVFVEVVAGKKAVNTIQELK